ncbi:phage tail protein [Planctomycetota bacterium]
MHGMPAFFVPEENDANARYLLEIDSIAVAVFRLGEGLRSEREVLEIDEGGREFAISRLGPYAKGHITLEEGETDNPDLLLWFETCRDQDIFVSSRRTGHVIYVDGGGRERMRWRFKNARITEWIGPGEPPEPGEVYYVERLGISHEGLEPIPSRD